MNLLIKVILYDSFNSNYSYLLNLVNFAKRGENSENVSSIFLVSYL